MKKNISNKLIKLILLSVVSGASLAADDKWQFEIAPYFWAINMNGSEQIASRNTYISESFSDLFKHFKSGGMLWLAADKDKLGFFANAIFTKLEKDTDIGAVTIRGTAKLGIYTAGASYAVYKKQYSKAQIISVEPYLGLRYTVNDASVAILNTNLSAALNQQWSNPIIGSRFKYINRGWKLLFAADLGGTNFNTNNSINLNAFIGYNPQSSWQSVTFYAGYKYLYQKYITGTGRDYFAWNMRLFGPVLGISFSF